MFYKIILLFILFILFILIFFKNKDYFITNQNKWLGYRLGDIYIFWNKNNYLGKIQKKYKNSIGDLYLKNNKSKKRNIHLLKKIIDNKIKKENIKIPDKNCIILHLRLGDSIIDYKNNKFIYRKQYNGKYYATQIEKLNYLLPYVKNKKIIIIYGKHFKFDKKNNKLNELYLKKIKNFFKSNNIKFEEKLSGDPDTDFMYMCKSKFFVKSGGGYSDLISQIVKLNNNNVIDINSK